MPGSDRPLCFLFDNGSLRPAATLSLRKLAQQVAGEIATDVRPVSLLHSSGVPAEELEDRRAELLEPALLEFARQGGRHAVLLPLFFGPSAALTEYVPQRVAAIQRQHPDLYVHTASWLARPDDGSEVQLAQMLGDAVRQVLQQHRLDRPRVLLTDHGSPQRGVTKVRDRLAEQLARQLGDAVTGVTAASMERREGDAYSFNEPLLEHALARPPHDTGDVVIALQFLQAGRHAGPGGDIAEICRTAESRQPGLRTYLTEPLVSDARLIQLLRQRYEEALLAPPAE